MRNRWKPRLSKPSASSRSTEALAFIHGAKRINLLPIPLCMSSSTHKSSDLRVTGEPSFGQWGVPAVAHNKRA